jgi:hypothetical protein
MARRPRPLRLISVSGGSGAAGRKWEGEWPGSIMLLLVVAGLACEREAA